ncbi:MAG: DUF4167 domain-containing protein [Alphaproteobacteria bacterium]
MRQVTNSRRSRNRNGRKPHSSSKQHSFDSNGPDVKVRGSAGQVAEKYLNLARDALTSGDRIAAENYFQHAEHYYRLSNPRQNNDGAKQQGAGNAGNGSQPAHGQPGNGSAQAMDRGAPQPSAQPNGQQPSTQPSAQADSQPSTKPSTKPGKKADKKPGDGAGQAADKATSDEADTKPETSDSGESAAT